MCDRTEVCGKLGLFETLVSKDINYLKMTDSVKLAKFFSFLESPTERKLSNKLSERNQEEGGAQFSARMSKPHSRCPGTFLTESIFQEKLEKNNHFSDLKQNFSGFLQKILAMLSKMHSNCPGKRSCDAVLLVNNMLALRKPY